jgi:hypothetical protein
LASARRDAASAEDIAWPTKSPALTNEKKPVEKKIELLTAKHDAAVKSQANQSRQGRQ